MKKFLLVGLIATLLFSCAKEDKVAKVERAFYYWKSDNSIGYMEEKLRSLEVRKVYIKFFEVDYSEAKGNFPYDKWNSYNDGIFNNKAPDIAIIPTIFIKNEIFKYNTEKNLDDLASNIVFLVDKRCNEKHLDSIGSGEIQIDCDWTRSTKDKYFYLLKKIKEVSKREISSTIRLYPYKYKDIMGVPPVDKAMLMCYNLIKPMSQSNKNSILDIGELKSYLNEKRDYPLHLDVALPVFGWSQLYQNGHFQGLVDVNSAQLKTFTKPTKPMWYEVTKDTTWHWQEYYRVADQIKCEEVSAQTLNEAIAVIKKNVSLDKNTTIALFDLDESIFSKYSHEEITGFYDNFTK